ncbi:hypothetical protein GCM10027160_25490 [Streptomyces calidiresistens]
MRNFSILKHRGKPWAVALADRNDVIHAFLPWRSWFSGDPALIGMRKFCDDVGISTKNIEVKPYHSFSEAEDNSSPWGWRKYSEANNVFSFYWIFLLGPTLWLIPMLIFAPNENGQAWIGLAGMSVAVAVLALRGIYRYAWLQRPLRMPPVSEVEYRWERKQREREPEGDHG